MFNQRAFLVCEFSGKSARICCCDAVSVTSTKQIGVIPFLSFNLCLCHLLVDASALRSFACLFLARFMARWQDCFNCAARTGPNPLYDASDY